MKISQAAIYEKHLFNHKSGNADTAEILELFNYFSLFKHPLKAEEMYKFSFIHSDVEAIKNVLCDMKCEGSIKQIDEYYLLKNDPENCIEKRIKGEQKAAALLPKAKKVGRFISLFPFVKFVGISGSLSKHYADDKTDYDFFIITANNTLWICRTILHIVKKLSFIIGLQRCLCMNYFIDEHHLKLDECNLFTRVELSTLIPVYNENIYRTFLLRNQNILSNIQHLGIDFTGAVRYNLMKRDRRNLFWKPLNIFLMKLTDIKWKRKWGKRNYPMNDYALAFKTTPYVSKNHPKNYQKKILEQL